MKEIRSQIDNIDREIIHLLGKRKRLIIKIAEFKKIHNLPIRDPKREEEVMNQLEIMAEKEGLNPEYIKPIFEVILKWSRKIQQD